MHTCMDQQLLHYIFKQRIRVINLKKKKVCQEIQHPKLQLLIPPLCSEKSQLFLTADVTKLIALDVHWIQAFRIWPTGPLDICPHAEKSSDIQVGQAACTLLPQTIFCRVPSVDNNRRSTNSTKEWANVPPICQSHTHSVFTWTKSFQLLLLYISLNLDASDTKNNIVDLRKVTFKAHFHIF